ncbi:SDR family oxidoreductase [Jannaschia sp. W003]|uniref:SDR family oxidoreductase n=1 Tax=Jannaschia sp. W003 TaxID=2867012 RepID=UPI0021A7D45B|nr:SDR family oxidoreductase [Jannaschia sp. W003]UWQ21552.1 SDR family oxidoreductase [Jannaschia sp. W003]
MTQTSDREAVLILGGRSDIGQAIAARFAAAGHAVNLAARGAASLEPARADMALRHGVPVSAAEFDVLDTAAMAGFVDGLDPEPGIVVCVVGAMGKQAESERDLEAAARVMRSNYEGPALILGLFAERMAARGRGVIVGVSSVAGDRGRASNYVYGSAKAGFTAFLSGLRNRLHGAGVRVITVKPGFVATRMTEGMDTPTPLTAQPDEVGRAVLRAVEGRGGDVLYVRPVWRLVMGIIGALPESVFKKTRL